MVMDILLTYHLGQIVLLLIVPVCEVGIAGFKCF